MTDVVVTDHPDKLRFEAHCDGDLAGFVDYQLTDELLVLTHTEVDTAFEGKGIGSALARASLDAARERGLKALIICPFITSWIGTHREYVDVVYGARPSNARD